MRLPNPSVHAVAATALALGLAVSAPAAPLQIILPTLTVLPGGTVDVPINLSSSPAGLGIVAVDFRLTLDPAIVQSSQSLSDGLLQTWGTPFVNATTSFVAAAAAGATPVATTGVLVNTVRLTVKASVAPGTDMPLQFDHFTFDAGTPSVTLTNGVLRIRSGAGIAPESERVFSLAPAAPDPASGSTRLAFVLPPATSERVVLSIYALDGRLVRTLVDGALGAGPHDVAWDLRDGGGRPASPGLYFVRLAQGSRHLEHRLVVCR